MKKKILFFSLLCLFFSFFLAEPLHTEATPSTGCDSEQDILGIGCGKAAGLTDTDPRILTVKIINVILSFLGIIAVVLVMYAGFTWMTAGGNEDKIATAKQILYAAVVGLMIIFVSYSISSYVMRTLVEVTDS